MKCETVHEVPCLFPGLIFFSPQSPIRPFAHSSVRSVVCHLINIITENNIIWQLSTFGISYVKISELECGVCYLVDEHTHIWVELASKTIVWLKRNRMCARAYGWLHAIKNTYGDLTNVICVHKWIPFFRLLLQHARMPRRHSHARLFMCAGLVCQCQRSPWHWEW